MKDDEFKLASWGFFFMAVCMGITLLTLGACMLIRTLQGLPPFTN